MKEPIHNKKLTEGRFVARKRVYTVWTVFNSSNVWQMYRCPDCSSPIAQYKGEAVSEVPGEFPVKYPVLIQCKNVSCGRKVMFADTTEQIG